MAEIKKRDLTMVPFENLVVKEGFNIRLDMGDVRSLADSIRENGVKQALRGYKEKGSEMFVVVDGHRRHAACALLLAEGSETIYVPFICEPQKYSDEQRVLDMFVMNDGKQLTPLEQASGVQRLINFGWSEKDIATRTGKSINWISKLSSLHSAPKRMHKLIENGRVSATHAMDIIAKGETDKFLKDVESGFYDVQQATNGTDLFEHESEKPVKTKITKSATTLNSWSEFKKWAKNADDTKFSEEGARFFKYLCRMMNNEIGEQSFKSFFSK